jgi:hypothetical protein
MYCMAYVRTQRLEIRLSPLEKAAWLRKAKESGLDLAEWIRVTLNDRTGHDISKERALAEASGAAAAIVPVAVEKKRTLCPACQKLQWIWGKPAENCKDCGII